MKKIDFPQLTAEEQKELLFIYHTSKDEVARKEAKDQLVLCNQRMIYKEIHNLVDTKKYTPDELFSYGVEGLIEAIEKFDLTKKVNFSTYAYNYIQKHIRLGYREISGVELPAWAWDKRSVFFKAQAQLREKLGREPSFEPCSIDTDGEFVSEIEEVLCFGKQPKMKPASYKTLVEYVVNRNDNISLDSVVNDDADKRTLGELLVDPKYFYQQEQHDLKFLLNNYIEEIVKQDKKEGHLVASVLKLKTQQRPSNEICELLGISRSVERRLEKRGIEFLSKSKELREIAKNI